MTRRDFVKAAGLAGATALTSRFACARTAGLAASRPNIVLIMTDDQGYGEMACHGNPIIRTPNLDRLHARSVRFTDFQVSPTCAPTRASLMTGRHEFRSGVTHTIYERERLSLDATTIVQVLKDAGYATGIFGKWHLGDEEAYQPDRRGFDEVFIHGAGGIGQTYPGSCGDAPGNTYFDPVILHNGTFVKTRGFCTDVFFERALDWIHHQSQKGGPFFAYIVPNAPHSPYVCLESYRKPYLDAGLGEADAAYYGMITNIDDNVGRLVARLDEWQLSERTLLIFMTDNGGTVGVKTFKTHWTGEGVYYRNGERKLYDVTSPIPPDPDAGDAIGMVLKLDELGRTISRTRPWTSPNALEYDGQTLETFKLANASTSGGRFLTDLATNSVWACEPRDISLLHTLFYISSAGNETEPGSFIRPVSYTHLRAHETVLDIVCRLLLEKKKQKKKKKKKKYKKQIIKHRLHTT